MTRVEEAMYAYCKCVIARTSLGWMIVLFIADSIINMTAHINANSARSNQMAINQSNVMLRSKDNEWVVTQLCKNKQLMRHSNINGDYLLQFKIKTKDAYRRYNLFVSA